MDPREEIAPVVPSTYARFVPDAIGVRMRTILLTIAELAPLEEVAERLAEAARDLTGADFAAMGTYDQSGAFDRFATVGVDAKTRARIGHPPVGLGLLGEIQRRGTLMNIPEIAAHPSSSGFPPGHPAMGPFLGVPVVYGRRPIGAFYVTRHPGSDPFDAAAEEYLQELAPYAAVAMSNAITLEREQRRADLSEHLADLASILPSAADEDEVAAALLRTLHEAFPGRDVGVCFESRDEELVALPEGTALSGVIAAHLLHGPSGILQTEGGDSGTVLYVTGSEPAVCVGVSLAPGEHWSAADDHGLRQVANIGAIGLRAERRREAEAVLERYAVRDSIARDLHDDLIQSIYAIGLALRIGADDPATLRQMISDATGGLNEVIRDLRAYISQLSRGAEGLERSELLTTRIEALLRGAASPHWRYEIDLGDVDLSARFERQIYLIVREAVSNVHRHAHASHATLTLEHDEDEGVIRLEIEDDGRGFDRSAIKSSSVGLRSLEERVADLGGSVIIESESDVGTRIAATFPTAEGEIS